MQSSISDTLPECTEIIPRQLAELVSTMADNSSSPSSPAPSLQCDHSSPTPSSASNSSFSSTSSSPPTSSAETPVLALPSQGSSIESAHLAATLNHPLKALHSFLSTLIPSLSLFDALRDPEPALQPRSNAGGDAELLYQFLDALARLCDVPRRGHTVGHSCTAVVIEDRNGEPVLHLTSNDTQVAHEAQIFVRKVMKQLSHLESTSFVEALQAVEKWVTVYLGVEGLCRRYRHDPPLFARQESDTLLSVTSIGMSFRNIRDEKININ